MIVDAHNIMNIDNEQTHRQRGKSNRRKELEELRAENKELLKRIMIKNEQRKINKSKSKLKEASNNKKGSHVMSNLGALLNGDIDQRLSNSATCNQPPPPPAHISIKEIDVDMISSISGMNEQPRLVSPNYPSDYNFLSSEMNDNDLVSFGSTNFFTTLNNNDNNTATIEKDTLFSGSSSSSKSNDDKENDDPFNDDSTPISLSSSTHQQKEQKQEKNMDEDMQMIDDLAKRYSYSSSSNSGDESIKPTKQKDTRVSVVREQHMNEIEKLRKLQEQQQLQPEQENDDDGLIQNSCSDDTKKQDETEAENDDEFELPFEQLLQEAEMMVENNCDNNEEEEGYIGVVNAAHPTNKESGEVLRRVPSLTLHVSSISSTIKKSIRRRSNNNNKVADKKVDENDKENVHPILGYKKGMSSKKIPLVQRDIPSALREQKDKSTTSKKTKEEKTVRFDEYTKEANDVICVHGGGMDNNAHDISYDYDDDDTRDITLDESITVNPAGGCAADYFSWLANCGQDDNQDVEAEIHEVDDDETMDNTMESSLISMDDTATSQVSTLFGLHTLVDSGCKIMSISDASKVHTLY